MLTSNTIRELILHLEDDLREATERLKTTHEHDYWAARRDELKRHLAELRRMQGD